eukprot:491982-Prorocentrum_minimum.AAC.4
MADGRRVLLRALLQPLLRLHLLHDHAQRLLERRRVRLGRGERGGHGRLQRPDQLQLGPRLAPERLHGLLALHQLRVHRGQLLAQIRQLLALRGGRRARQLRRALLRRAHLPQPTTNTPLKALTKKRTAAASSLRPPRRRPLQSAFPAKHITEPFVREGYGAVPKSCLPLRE